MKVIVGQEFQYQGIVGWIAKNVFNGFIEGNQFTVKISINVENPKEDVIAAYEIYSYSRKDLEGDGDFVKIEKFNLERKKTLPLSGDYESRVYLKSNSNDFEIYDKDGSWVTAKEGGNYTVIPYGTLYHHKKFKVYSKSELIIFLLVVISAIGAIFEIFNFFLKP